MEIIRFHEVETRPASHEDPKAPAVLKKVLLAGEDLQEGRVQMINWSTLLPGRAFRKHFHDNMEEVFVIVSGHARILVDEEEAEITNGDAVVIPAGAVHSMENLGPDSVEFISLGIAPGKRGRTVVTE